MQARRSDAHSKAVLKDFVRHGPAVTPPDLLAQPHRGPYLPISRLAQHHGKPVCVGRSSQPVHQLESKQHPETHHALWQSKQFHETGSREPCCFDGPPMVCLPVPQLPTFWYVGACKVVCAIVCAKSCNNERLHHPPNVCKHNNFQFGLSTLT